MDDGIDAPTVPVVVQSEATMLVAGSAIFGERDGVTDAIARLQTVIGHPERERERAGRAAL